MGSKNKRGKKNININGSETEKEPFLEDDELIQRTPDPTTEEINFAIQYVQHNLARFIPKDYSGDLKDFIKFREGAGGNVGNYKIVFKNHKTTAEYDVILPREKIIELAKLEKEKQVSLVNEVKKAIPSWKKEFIEDRLKHINLNREGNKNTAEINIHKDKKIDKPTIFNYGKEEDRDVKIDVESESNKPTRPKR